MLPFSLSFATGNNFKIVLFREIFQGRLAIRDGCYTNTSYPVDMLFRVFYPSSRNYALRL